MPVRRRIRNQLHAWAAASRRDDDTPPRLTLPSAAIYSSWGFAAAVEEMAWDLTVDLDPGESVGEYLALFNGSIDGSMCYLGLQTDVFSPDAGGGIGKGLIFSTWWTFDAADARVASAGFSELGTHEGTFVGVRRPYRWGNGDYRVTLSRGEPEVAGGRILDWFDLSIEPTGPLESTRARPVPVGGRTSVGALRFPRRHREVPARIEPGGLMFLEVYAGARTWAEVAPWRVDVMAYGDGVQCPSGRTEYPRPYGRGVYRVSARHNPKRARIELELGTDEDRPHPPGPWPEVLGR